MSIKTRPLDVLFVVPMNPPDLPGGVPDAIEPPKDVRFMAAYLHRRGYGLHLTDPNVTNQTPEQVAEEVSAADPSLIVTSVRGFNPTASTMTMPSARELARAIKQRSPNVPILFQGLHPASVPELTLKTEPDVDFVCGGEGPTTVHELLQAIQVGGARGIEKVRSLWYRQDGGITHTAPAPLLDLNAELAIDGWKYMDPRKYVCHHWHAFYTDDLAKRSPYVNPGSSEGCFASCGFCPIQAQFREGESESGSEKNSFRKLRPELFVEELQYLVDTFDVRQVKIPDEMFGAGNHPLQITKLIRERFGESLNIWCYYRIDTCKPDQLETLRSAGIRWLGLGIEAADSTVRDKQDKGFSDERIRKVIAALHAAGIEGGLNFIFGLEGDTMKSMEATYRLACELNGAYGNFYCAQAYPGSGLYDKAIAAGYPFPKLADGRPDWRAFGQYAYESFPCYMGNELTSAQILQFRDEKHRAYYARPEWRNRIRKDPKFGEPAIRTIDAWLAALAPDKLRRKIIEEAHA